ncbi:MAG: hypothetical protein E7L31_21515 [Aeromonas sp.]|nr:hypothetical protein [Aeromonas sp.]
MSNDLIQRICEELYAHRFNFNSEVQLHEGIMTVLSGAGIPFEHEKDLGDPNRVDFYCDDGAGSGVVIEVKIKGTVAEALRQVNRYIHQPSVSGVILASSAPWGRRPLTSLPKWDGKPFEMVAIRSNADQLRIH